MCAAPARSPPWLTPGVLSMPHMNLQTWLSCAKDCIHSYCTTCDYQLQHWCCPCRLHVVLVVPSLSPFLRWQLCLPLLIAVQLAWTLQLFWTVPVLPTKQTCVLGFSGVSKDTIYFFKFPPLFLNSWPLYPTKYNQEYPCTQARCFSRWERGWGERVDPGQEIADSHTTACCKHHHSPLRNHDGTVCPQPVSLHLRFPAFLEARKMAAVSIASGYSDPYLLSSVI